MPEGARLVLVVMSFSSLKLRYHHHGDDQQCHSHDAAICALNVTLKLTRYDRHATAVTTIKITKKYENQSIIKFFAK